MLGFNDIVSRTRRGPLGAVVWLTSAGLVACGGSGGMAAPSTPPSPPPPTVNATPQLAFTPAQLALIQRGAVTFVFGSVGHNVYFDNDPAGAPANIPGVNSNTSVTRTFDTVGVYNFYCRIHPGMHGSITVVAPDTV